MCGAKGHMKCFVLYVFKALSQYKWAFLFWFIDLMAHNQRAE